MYGWDITPRAVSAGIWRPSSSRSTRRPRSWTWPMPAAGIDGDDALLGVHWQFRTDARRVSTGFALRFSGVCGDSRFERRAAARFIAGHAAIRVPQAQALVAQGLRRAGPLRRDGASCSATGRSSTGAPTAIGLRTVQPRADRDHHGHRAGRVPASASTASRSCARAPTGCRWTPSTAATRSGSSRVLALVDDLGCNIVRCWGGNVYEDHAFFDLCDAHGHHGLAGLRHGLRASTRRTTTFLGAVRAEAAQVVRKLRNHPSLALWARRQRDRRDLPVAHGHATPNTNRTHAARCCPRSCADARPLRGPTCPARPTSRPRRARRQAARADAPARAAPLGPARLLQGPVLRPEHARHFASEIGYHGCPNVVEPRALHHARPPLALAGQPGVAPARRRPRCPSGGPLRTTASS